MSARRIRTAALLVGIAVVVLGVVLALNVEDGGPTVDQGGLLGQRPAFALETLDGRALDSEALRGKTVVVNFWNTWCLPCIAEAPALQSFYEAHAREPDFVMVGIVRDDSEAAVRAHVGDEGVGWHVAMDPGSRAALAFGVTGQPETFVIGPDGAVAGEKRAEVSVADLELMLRRARGQQ